MASPSVLEGYGFKFHPFPPAATGVAFAGDLWIPDTWSRQLLDVFDDLYNGSGPKATTLVGAYGSGKTYVLHWIAENWFAKNRIQPYYIGNPGLAFYGIADEVFRKLGRSEFSKAVWQALVNQGSIFVPQSTLFGSDFHHWLQSLSTGASKQTAQRDLSSALLEAGLADDEEVAFRYAQMIVGTRDRPYYTFRDFIPRSATSVVAEQQEPALFRDIDQNPSVRIWH